MQIIETGTAQHAAIKVKECQYFLQNSNNETINPFKDSLFSNVDNPSLNIVKSILPSCVHIYANDAPSVVKKAPIIMPVCLILRSISVSFGLIEFVSWSI